MFDTILPFAENIGATAIIFALLIYSYKQSQQQHERSMARDKQMIETLERLTTSLMDCVRQVKETH
jgi:hypothetical protein